MQSQGAYHTDTKHTYTYIHTRTHWTWCPLSGRPLYCGIVWTISSWMIKQCISQPSLWWRVCVWSSSECAALSTTACDMCERAREGVYFGCLSVYSHTLLCATYMRTSKCFELLWWAPVDCVSLLTRLPTAAPACEKLLLGPFNGETLVWEKVAKSWEKRALSRRGREGVNHERTCLWLHTHSCSARAHTQAHGLRNERMEKAQRTPQTQTCARFFCQRDKTRTIKNLIRNKANKHSCFTQYRGHTDTRPTHMLSQGFLSHKPCMAKLSGERECVCVCMCVRFLGQGVSLWYKAQLSQLKIQCHLPLQRAGLFVPSHLDQNRGSSVWTQKYNTSIFKCYIYKPTHFLKPRTRLTFKGTFNLNYFAVLFDFTGYLTFTFIHHMIRFGHY